MVEPYFKFDEDKGEVTELEGRWIVGYADACEDNGDNSFSRAILIVSGNTFNYQIETYYDSLCSEVVSIKPKESWRASFIIGNAVTTSSGLIAKEIDFISNKDAGNVWYYNIFRVDDGKLYFGKEASSSEEKRPINLEPNPHYVVKRGV